MTYTINTIDEEVQSKINELKQDCAWCKNQAKLPNQTKPVWIL